MEQLEHVSDEEEEEEGHVEAVVDIKKIKKEGYKIDQLYCVHNMLRQSWKSNFGAPVRDLLCSGAKVLDVGCGSGYWTLEMATDFPSSRFYGVNSVSSFPDSVLPKNVRFQVSDILTDGLPFKDAEFDYVFARNIMFTFQKPNFESIVMKEILRVVKPGSYIEIVEEEITECQNRGESLIHWNVNGLKPWLESQDIDCEIIYRFKELLINTNQLKDITEQKLKIPLGKNGGFIGGFAAEHVICNVNAMADNLMPIMNLTNEEYCNLIEEIKKEIGEASDNYFWYRRYLAIKM